MFKQRRILFYLGLIYLTVHLCSIFQSKALAETFIDVDFYANSSTLPVLDSEDVEYSNYLGFFNPTDQDIDLSGFMISNKTNLQSPWKFPQGSIIKAGIYIHVFLDGKDLVNIEEVFHTDFIITPGETISFLDVNGNVLNKVVINEFIENQAIKLISVISTTPTTPTETPTEISATTTIPETSATPIIPIPPQQSTPPQSYHSIALDNDEAVTNADTPVSIDLLSNDIYATDETLDIIFIEPTIGKISFLPNNGGITYDPKGKFPNLLLGQTVIDQFRYVVKDGNGQTMSATVRVTIIGTNVANHAPIAVDDQITVDINKSILIRIYDNDRDPDAGDVINYNGLNLTGLKGAVTVMPDGILYSPMGKFNHLTEGQTAAETFTYSIKDSKSATASAKVTITIRGIKPVVALNHPPVARDDYAVITSVQNFVNIPVNVAYNDSDEDGDALTIDAIDSTGLKGQVVMSGNQLIYIPSTQFNDLKVGQLITEHIKYTIKDSKGLTATAILHVIIEGRKKT